MGNRWGNHLGGCPGGIPRGDPSSDPGVYPPIFSFRSVGRVMRACTTLHYTTLYYTPFSPVRPYKTFQTLPDPSDHTRPFCYCQTLPNLTAIFRARSIDPVHYTILPDFAWGCQTLPKPSLPYQENLLIRGGPSKGSPQRPPPGVISPGYPARGDVRGFLAIPDPIVTARPYQTLPHHFGRTRPHRSRFYKILIDFA